ncbi:MAG: MATE family efflux transporter [Bacillota bacterium]
MSKTKTARAINMSTDPIKKCIVKLALPMMVAQLVNMLYSMVDRIYIGNISEIGNFAFAGMTVAYPIIAIVAAFAALGAYGASPLVGIKLGEKDREGAQQILSNSFFMLTIFGVTMTAVIMLFRADLLIAFGATENNFQYAYEYLSIYMIGTIFVMYALGLNVFITAQGFSTRAMKSVILGAVINIVLDPIFIFGLGMATKGAALATIIAQFCSAIYIMSFLFSGKGILKLDLKNFKPNPKIIKSFLALGAAPFIMYVTEAAVQIVFNIQMTNYGGDMTDYLITTVGICISLLQVVLVPVSAFAQGAAPFVSFNFGSGNMQRVKSAVKFTLTVTFTIAFIIAICAISVPELFVRIFNQDPIVIAYGKQYIPIFFAGLTLMGVQTGMQNTFLALGKAKISLCLACLRKLVLLIPALLILPIFLGVDGVFYAEAISDFIAIGTTVVVFSLMFGKILKQREQMLLEKAEKEAIANLEI